VTQLPLTIVMCAALVLGINSFASFPAQVPTLVDAWDLSYTQVGWIAGIYFAGYVVAAPVFSLLADRIDPRRIVIFGALCTTVAGLLFANIADGFWTALPLRFLAGIGFAGAYMPGLKVITDRVTDATRTRNIVLYTSSFSIGTAVSYFSAGELGAVAWQYPFWMNGLFGLAVVALVLPVPRAEPHHLRQSVGHLLDIRPVLRSRPTRAFIVGYTVHTWEMMGARAWVVALLAYNLAGSGTWLTPTRVATLSALAGLLSSIAGNEIALRWNRRYTIALFTGLSASVTLVLGIFAHMPYAGLALLCFIQAFFMLADSGSITAGMVERAPAGYAGATMAVYTVFGFGAGAVAPFVVGWVLDLAGGPSSAGWAFAYACLAAPALVSIWSMLTLGRHEENAAAAAASRS
jgi:MFS family permease